MPSLNDLKRSRFLTQKDVDPAIMVTISDYEEVNMALEGAEPEMSWVLKFREVEKPWAVNSTNGQIIASLCQQIKGLPPEKAEDFQNWIGIRIVLYRDPNIAFRGKITGGIRCRAPNPAKVKPQAMQQSGPEPEQFFDPTAPPDDGIPF
jgi:hypothetical protein